jgi:hypothetical protein
MVINIYRLTIPRLANISLIHVIYTLGIQGTRPVMLVIFHCRRQLRLRCHVGQATDSLLFGTILVCLLSTYCCPIYPPEEMKRRPTAAMLGYRLRFSSISHGLCRSIPFSGVVERDVRVTFGQKNIRIRSLCYKFRRLG